MPLVKNPFSEEQLKDIIRQDFPFIKLTSTKLHNNGWANVALDVNDEYIFRFPKDAEAEFLIDKELPLLNFLHGKITLPIPYPEFIGKTRKYIGYKKIKGGNLTSELYESLSESEKDKLAFDLANFAAEFHASVSIEKARELGIPDYEPLTYVDGLYNKLVKHFSDKDFLNFIQETIEEYISAVKTPSEIVVLYEDMHGENMAFDSMGKKLNGVFDFADVEIGELEREFMFLYMLDKRLLNDVVSKYENLTKKTLSLRKIIMYRRICEMDDLSQCLNDPESTIYRNAVKNIYEWMKEKDIYKNQ